MSYKKLSSSHRTFTSRIGNLKLVFIEEINALKQNGTWKLVDLHKNKKLTGLNGRLL